MNYLEQNPKPGSHFVHHCGDLLTVTLKLKVPRKGTAWLRTNLGRARERRKEIIAHVEQRSPIRARDWHDMAMLPSHSENEFIIHIPLVETGRFEAKAFFVPQGEATPLWAEGDNTVIKVETALSYCANTIYTAFVRQFGPNMRKTQDIPVPEETLKRLEDNGCTLIPQSGTFRSLITQLDFIITTMGFRIVQCLPIHPVPTTYARMGRFGSPFATIDYYNVDPALAEFDRHSTPLDQFTELVDAIHQRDGLLFLDLPINHTGWASQLQLHHPEWFARNPDASFASPGAWGVTWEDLSELDYQHRELWVFMADVFLFWCGKGVDGFRCDAGYMIPLPVWEYIVAKVRETYPDTLFLLEGLGGKLSVMHDLLDRGNMDWAYSEIFQVFERDALESSITTYVNTSQNVGTLVNFAETHDNNRLASVSQQHATMRTALAALTSTKGAFGIANGVEWFAEAKVDVHGAPPLNWDNPINQVLQLSALNHILRHHPAFFAGASIRVIPSTNAVLMLIRESIDADVVLVLINLDTSNPSSVTLPHSIDRVLGEAPVDLLTGKTVEIHTTAAAEKAELEIPAGASLCLSRQTIDEQVQQPAQALTQQRAKALAMRLYTKLAAKPLEAKDDIQCHADRLRADPVAYCASLIEEGDLLQVMTEWSWTEDTRRTVMLPHNHFLFLRSPYPFHVTFRSSRANRNHAHCRSLPFAHGEEHFAFLFPEPVPDNTLQDLRISVFKGSQTLHQEAAILQLDAGRNPYVRLRFNRESLRDSKRCAILTNGRGAMSQVRLEWGRIYSQYDAWLAANLHPSVPENRRILLTRCRVWLVHRDYSYEVGLNCTRHVHVLPGKAVTWHFNVPAGMGKSVPLIISLTLSKGRNRIEMDILRPSVDHHSGTFLEDAAPARLILRPDIEHRDFHETTKAYLGPEYLWPSGITHGEQDFCFRPEGEVPLHVALPRSRFVHEPQWLYAVAHPEEADRGLEASGDVFSPGYFHTEIKGGQNVCMIADTEAIDDVQIQTRSVATALRPAKKPLDEVLQDAIRDFIVQRDQSLTVIAGYPWFLDWGRDTFICLRGMIAMGLIEEAKNILLQFARFEDRGTLPNMIRGEDHSNRDTSDAPLWFFTVCRDIMNAEGNAFLDADCGGRTLSSVLVSIGRHIVEGTPNGIRMDPESGLVFSPSHFTWMDTNHPAGSPREGYPIEIQALWHAALKLLQELDGPDPWQTRAQRVYRAINTLYRTPEQAYLSDCLHATSGTPAADAESDNALRPNQLLAITLGAVDDKDMQRNILLSTAKLLVPGAIRSLADQAVFPPLPIKSPQGLLNDPQHPYWGTYRGDEDTRRKPAYHNGTGWGWMFPSYCEALVLYSASLLPTARSLLSSLTHRMDHGCIGQLPEIVDGDHPHQQRGCTAQAWSVTEAARVLKRLDLMENSIPV